MEVSRTMPLRGNGACGSRSKWPSLPSQGSSSICTRAFSQGPRHARKQPQQQHSLSVSAATAAVDTFSPAEELEGIVPYANHRASQLKGRSIAVNPAQGAWQAAAKLALRAELLLAAAVDKHKLAPYVMAGAAGLLLGSGLDALSLLQHGMPAYLSDLLLCNFNVWDPALWTFGLTAAALPVTLWALRAWWRANIHLLAQSAAALQESAQQGLSQQQQLGELGQAGGQGMQQQGQQGSRYVGAALAAALAVLRGVCLSSAANSFMRVLYTKGLSSTATAVSAGIGAVSLAAAVALLLLPAQQQRGASSNTTTTSSKVLAPLLAAEAAWLAAVVGISPLVSAAAAAALGASLYLLHTSVVLPALKQYKSAAGDTVEVHVGLKLAGTRPVFDSTLHEQPLRVQVDSVVPAEVMQQWANAAAADDAADARQQEDAAADSSSSSGGGSEGGPLLPDHPLSGVQRDIQQWLQRPMARWEVLEPYVAQAAEGLYLGETASIPLYNPSGVGYWNPRFTWWQPVAEVEAKFGELPCVGDVFWYPVADRAAVPTRVNAIGKDFVELDANFGVSDTQLELQVQLVKLVKSA